VRLAGASEIEKPEEGFTVRLIGVVSVMPPLVPVIVTVAGPVAAVANAARVTTVLLPLVGVALNEAVTPVGRPLALNATEPAKPPVRAIAMVLVALAP
jgi:hypothetical protein